MLGKNCEVEACEFAPGCLGKPCPPVPVVEKRGDLGHEALGCGGHGDRLPAEP
jgi:hypothetical protein